MPKNRPEPSKGQAIQPPPKKRRQHDLLTNDEATFESRDLTANPSAPSSRPQDVNADVGNEHQDECANTNNNNTINDNNESRSVSPTDRFGGRYSELTRGFTNYLTSLSSTSSAIFTSHAARISSASHDDGRKFSVGDTSKESGAQYGSSCLTGPSDTLQNDSSHTCPEYSAPEVSKSGASPTSRAMDARKHDGSGDVSDSATDISDDSESKPKPSGDQRPGEMTKEEKKASYVSRRTCSYCGKVCFKPSDLQRHLLVHTGERPHKCEFCSRAFKSKGSLLYHRRVNHEASDTSLSVCLQEKYLRHKQSLAKRMRKAESKKEALQSYKILRSHLKGSTEPRTSTMMEGNFDNLLSLVGGSRIDLENSVAYQTFAPLIPNGDTDTSLDSFRLAVANQERYSDYGGEQDSRSGSVDDVKSTTTSTPVTSPLLGLATVASSIDRLANTRLLGNDEKYHHDDHAKRERFYDDRKWFQNAPIDGVGGGSFPTILRETLQKKCCSETGVCPGHCRTEVEGDVTCPNRRDDVIKADESENGSGERSENGSDESEPKSMTNLRETRIFSQVEGLENGHYVCFHKCHLCGKRLASLSLIRKHLANHSVTWRRCPVCHTTFKFHANLLRHLESEHEIKCESPSKAQDLSTSRSKQRKISESMEIVQNDLASNSHITARLNLDQRESKRKEGIFKCRYCRKTFFRLYCLQRHERVHTGVKTCFCRKCGRGFSELRNLRHHILRFHSGLDRAELIKMLSNGSGPKKSETESICKKFIITSSQVAKHTMAGTIDSVAKPKPDVQPETKSDLRKDLPVFYPDLYLTSSYPMSMSYSGGLAGLPPVPVFDRAPPIFPVVDYGRYHPLLSPTTTVPSTSASSSAVTPSSSTGPGLSRVLISPTRLASLTAYVPPQRSPDGKPDTRSLASSSPSPTETDLKKKGNNFSKHSSRLDIVRDAVKTEAAYQPVMSLDGRSVYKCPYCPKTFVGASDLTRHLNFHADLRPYKCELCEYSAKTNSQLKVHMRRHQGIREFKCTLCNYEGVTRSDLNRHFRSQTHINLTVEKQYQGLDANGGSQPGGKSGAESGLDLSKPWRQQSSNHYSKHQFRCAACEFEGHSQEDLRQHLLSETHINKMVKKHDLKMAELPIKQEVPIQPTLSNGHAERPSVVSWRPRPDTGNHRHDGRNDGRHDARHDLVLHKAEVLKFDFRVVETRLEAGETRVKCSDARARSDYDSGHAGREEKVPNHHENSDTEEEQVPNRVIVIDT